MLRVDDGIRARMHARCPRFTVWCRKPYRTHPPTSPYHYKRSRQATILTTFALISGTVKHGPVCEIACPGLLLFALFIMNQSVLVRSFRSWTYKERPMPTGCLTTP